MSFALSGSAMAIAGLTSYGIITGSKILPPLTGPVLAVVIIGSNFVYGFSTRKRRKTAKEEKQQKKLQEIHDEKTANINHDHYDHDYYFQQK